MPGVGELPKEGFTALTSELERAQGDVEDYARANYPAVSLAEAIRRLLPEAMVTGVAGTGVLPSNPADIPTAVAAAAEADLVVLYIGGKGGWYGDDLTEKEGGDTANIDLPPQQVELVSAVLDVGKPTVAVVAMARPQGLAAVIERLPAVLTCYYGGPYQGAALADALFGIANRAQRGANGIEWPLPRHFLRTGNRSRLTALPTARGLCDNRAPLCAK
jgi:glycosyl hydrolase family 3